MSTADRAMAEDVIRLDADEIRLRIEHGAHSTNGFDAGWMRWQNTKTNLIATYRTAAPALACALIAAQDEIEKLRRVAVCADAQWSAEADAEDSDNREERAADALWAGGALILALEMAGYSGNTPYRECADLHSVMMQEYDERRAIVAAQDGAGEC